MTSFRINLIGTEKDNRFRKIANRIEKDMISYYSEKSIEAKGWLDGTVVHWGDPPRIVRHLDTSGDEIIAFIGPVGTREQVAKWRILNRGAPRYAVMKPSFIRKTHEGTLTTNPGTIPSKSGVAYYTWPWAIDYILPRAWTNIVMLEMWQKMPNKVRAIIKQAVRSS